MSLETTDVIIHGATVSQLCALFKMDARDVKPRISAVTPCGTRRGAPLYRVHEVAPMLSKKAYTDDEIERMIQKMSISDLPAILRKEFWAGLRSRQLYEKEAATLVKADDVADMIGDLFGELRMSLLLSRDLAERETEFTDRQRHIYTEHIDRTLESIQTAINQKFGEVKAHVKQIAKTSPPVDDDDEL